MKEYLFKVGLASVILSSVMILANVNEALATDDEKLAPSCEMSANPDVIQVGGAITLSWYANVVVAKAKLYPKGSEHLIREFSETDRGSWWISGIIDSREYTLVIESRAGEIASCNASVDVVINNDEETGDNQFSESSSSNNDKDNKYKKYRGSDNKKIYKKIKSWKKNKNPLYYDYKKSYKKYKPLSNGERKIFWGLADYSKYKEYKVYKKYKKYKKEKE